jgi:hypothetical protein
MGSSARHNRKGAKAQRMRKAEPGTEQGVANSANVAIKGWIAPELRIDLPCVHFFAPLRLGG